MAKELATFIKVILNGISYFLLGRRLKKNKTDYINIFIFPRKYTHIF